MRAAAEVLEGAVSVERDGLDAFVADQVLDQLDLEALVLGAEDLERLGDRHVAAAERLVGGDVLRIASSIFGRSSSVIRTSAGNSKS